MGLPGAAALGVSFSLLSAVLIVGWQGPRWASVFSPVVGKYWSPWMVLRLDFSSKTFL